MKWPGKFSDALALLAILTGIGLFMLWRQSRATNDAHYFSPADKIRSWAEGDYQFRMKLASPPAQLPLPPPLASFAITSETRGSEAWQKYTWPRPAASPPAMLFAGERATPLAAGKFSAAGHTFELAALATYRRTAPPPAGSDERNVRLPFTALATPAGAPLDRASLSPQELQLVKELPFSVDQQTGLGFLFRNTVPPDQLHWKSLSVFDAQTHVLLSSGFSSSIAGSAWFHTVDLTTLVSRPLTVVCDGVILSTQTTELAVTTGSTCRSELLAIRLHGQVECWSNASMFWGSEGDSSYFCVHPTSLPPPRDEPITTQTEQFFLFETQPAWAADTFDCQALDARGNVQPVSRNQSDSIQGFRLRQFATNGANITRLRLRLPVRSFRLQFDLPGIAGLPALEGNNLFNQQVVDLSLGSRFAYSPFLSCYAQIQLGNLGLARLPGPSRYDAATLDEIMQDYVNETLAEYPDYTLVVNRAKVEFDFDLASHRGLRRSWRRLLHLF